ncbi:MAG TPA: hypothetical protein ENJ95_23995 [Bacteroidetes bacterium]|nr:hypothetical protein [Bacteroidota bacterium]
MCLLNNSNNWLHEFSDRKDINDFAVWALKKLHLRLLKKHNETFWIEAESTVISGREHFLYRRAEYTRKPIISQFDVLLEQGLITVDHLIKRKNNGSVTDKGPSFKLKSNALNLLFPPSLIYNLLPDGN